MASKDRQIPARINFYDGQKVTESDMDTEQIHKTSVISNMILDFHGSGVVDDNPFEDTILFDTRFPGTHVIDSSDENASKEDIENGSYDGKAIYLDRQPTDTIRGNRLVLELVDSSVLGRKTAKVLIIGRAFDGVNEVGELVVELIEFKNNEEKLTSYYYRQIIAILFNNFSGGVGKTETETSAISEDLITDTGGYLTVKEAEPLKVYSNPYMSYQIESPNIGLRNFITSDINNSISDEITEALGSAISITDMYIELDGQGSISFSANADSTISYGQKFLSYSNNIQRIDLLLAVIEDTSVPAEQKFDWSGDLVISIHELSSEPKCSTDAIPDDLINFDPELSPIVEMSFSQADFEGLGFVLNDTSQLISFNFAGTLIADPQISPSVQTNKYYAFLISRRGDNRTGTILLEKGFDKVTKKNLDGVPLTTIEEFSKQQSKFTEFDPNTQRYIDDSSSSLWYIVHSDDVEVVNGTAYSDDGFAITLEKTEDFIGNSEISKFERHISLANISSDAKNYVVLSHSEKFTTPRAHPRTGNRTFTRIEDTGLISIVDATGLTDLLENSTPLLLAKVIDQNVRDAQSITGEADKPGIILPDRVIIIDPSTELSTSNLIGRIFIPDTNCQCTARYRIGKVECNIIKTGDLNDDGDITNADLSLLLNIVGNTINSEATERKILSGELDLQDFLLSDLDSNDTVDGFDIELMEDAIDGYINFTTAEEIKFLTLRLENILEDSDSPIIFTDILGSGITTANSSTLLFEASSEQKALIIRSGDTVEIEQSSLDAGVYTIATKSIASDNLTVTVTVLDSTGTAPIFIGDLGFNVTIVSGTEVNTYVDNNSLVNVPFTSTSYSIDFVEYPYDEVFLNICDLRRFVGVSFIEQATNTCICEETDCLSTPSCEPIYKNQTFIPGDLYVTGDILSDTNTPYHGDFEFAKIQIPLPPGSITDCAINLYTNFIKADDLSSCKTASGYPAMKYSDGTYVGCDDNGADTDLTKGRVKISQAIGSLYVDSLIDGYATDGYADATASSSSEELVTENFIDHSYTSFSTWIEDPFNNVIITTLSHPSGTNQPATFQLTTALDASLRFGRLNTPAVADDFEDDFVVDWTASRTTWPSASLTSGVISSFMTLTVDNVDGSSAEYKLGWMAQVSGTVLFFSGTTTNSLSVVTSSFSHQVSAPDSLGDDVLFRFRRINDVITAHYLVPGAISELETPFGQYVRIGTNPTIQAGSGPASISFEINQNSLPNVGLAFFTSLSEVVIKSSYLSNDSPTSVTIGRDALTSIIDRVAYTFPINLTSRTNIVSANLILTSASNATITDTFNVIPLDILNADNLGKYYDYPLSQNNSLIASFAPGTIVSGGSITIDVTNAVISMMAEAGHLPGFIKGFVIEPDLTADSEFLINTAATLEIGYEDITTGVIFKVGISIDPTTGIATFNTRNILYDAILEESRTVINFGVYLKKAGFINNDLYISIADIKRIGLGTCADESVLADDDECWFIAGSTATGTFVGGSFPCQYHLP